tara:strand:- start:1479 stop:1778 length:300 start_codon:yes stop_codon:yes gene_type:complete
MITLQRITVQQGDIFNYVVGNSLFDPIEKCIDSSRYEVFDTFIYDGATGQKHTQDDVYDKFCWEVTKLKNNASNMKAPELGRICEELEEIAPKQVRIHG